MERDFKYSALFQDAWDACGFLKLGVCLSDEVLGRSAIPEAPLHRFKMPQ